MNLLEMNPHETRYIPLIGSPIGGSTASYLYNQIFAAFGINAMSYPVEVKKGELPEFLAAVKFMNTPGCVLTSPHKQDIIQYIDDVDEASRVFRSVNTLRFREDGRIEGHGLDGKGVIGAFDDNDVDLKGKEVVMLGAGGISGIFATELANRGIRKLTILNRTVDKARYPLRCRRKQKSLRKWHHRNPTGERCLSQSLPARFSSNNLPCRKHSANRQKRTGNLTMTTTLL